MIKYLAQSFFVFFAFAAFLSTSAGAEGIPREITLQYDLMRNGSVMVEVSEQLRHGDGRYRIDSDAKGKGLLALSNRGSVRRSSEGEVVAGGIRPVEFRDRRGSGPLATARFDWAATVPGSVASTNTMRKGTVRPEAAPEKDANRDMGWKS